MIFIMLLCLTLPSVESVSPFQSVSSSSMIIETPPYESIQLGEAHRFHAHVINATSMKTNKTTSCGLHFYNSTGFDTNIGSTNMEFESYNGVDFALTLEPGNYSTPGQYAYVIFCNSTNEAAFITSSIYVTPLGISDTSSQGVVIGIFSVLFIIILATITYIFINSLGHAVKLDFDIIDLAFNYGAYFALVGIYLLTDIYLVNTKITDLLSIFVKVGVATNIVLPTIYFFLTLSIGSWMKQRVQGVDFGN